MKHLKAINRKARRVEEFIASEFGDVHGLAQQTPPQRPHFPMGCSLVFSPGWETDSAGGTAGLCQPVERDLYDCYITCFWPAQVPDHFQQLPGLDQQVRERNEGLAEHRSGVSVSSIDFSLCGAHLRRRTEGHRLKGGTSMWCFRE